VALLLAAMVAPGIAAPLDTCGWGVVFTPNASLASNELAGVAYLSANDVWAVGSYFTDDYVERKTLAEHWNGTAWTIVASQNTGGYNWLSAVAAISSDDVWAVGSDQSTTPNLTLAEHWDGTDWTVVPSPSPGATSSFLLGVAAISSADVWAVGYSVDEGASHTLTEHWDGLSWTVVPSPDGLPFNYLTGAVATSTDDVWAVGSTFDSGVPARTLTLHWDGLTWKMVRSPNVGTDSSYLSAATALSPSDVWAVGYHAVETTAHPLAMHWNGAAWTLTGVPSRRDGAILFGIARMRPGQVVAVGTTSAWQRARMYLWSGSRWKPVTGQSATINVLHGIAGTSIDDMWAVGTQSPYGTGRTVAEHRCG